MAAVAALAVASACTLEDQTAPSLIGPSELGLSLNMTASPDSVIRDGASQTLIVAHARGAESQPYPNLSMRLSIQCADSVGVRQSADFGSLSAKTVATGSDGRATIVYTAPPDPSPLDPYCADNSVWVTATPILDNYANQFTREVQIRLVPPGVIVPPSDLVPKFTYSPDAPKKGLAVTFDATTSTGAIASFAWSFGDGGTATGSVVSHTFTRANTYEVTLTVYDVVGRAASTTKIVTVGVGAAPTPTITVSPSSPTINNPVFFTGAATPGTGRTIVGYDWDFGDGGSGSGAFASHIYTAAGTYQVILTATDDIGTTGSAATTVTVSVAKPTAAFTVSPESGTAPAVITVNASTSTAATGRTIASYSWDFGNGAPAGSGVSSSTTYTVAGTYTITLTVTDDLGNTDSTSTSVTIS